MAGLLTLYPGHKRLPEFPLVGFSGTVFMTSKGYLQQRDCSGFSPDSLLIARMRTYCLVVQR